MKNLKLLITLAASTLIFVNVALSDITHMTPGSSGSTTIPSAWPFPHTPDGTPAPAGTQYFPGLPYWDPNGPLPAIEDPVAGLVIQNIIPGARSIVEGSDGDVPWAQNFLPGVGIGDGISFDPTWAVIPIDGGLKWTKVLPGGSPYGNNTWGLVGEPTPEIGDWIVTNIVLTGNETWLGRFTITEPNGLFSDTITLEKSVNPLFGGHLEVTFLSDVPEPGYIGLLGAGIVGLLALRRKRVI